MSNYITPPSSPILPIRKSHSHHSSNIEHSTIHSIHTSDKRYTILNTQIQNNNIKDSKLETYCDENISYKIKESIKLNHILPSEADKKQFKFKIFPRSNPITIKKNILQTLNQDNPKIIEFISNSIDFILLQKMDVFDRTISSIEPTNYYKIIITSKLNKRKLWFNYYIINIDITSISFL